MMNLLDSHDTERFLTTINGDLRKLKLATLFAMTYVGAPSIYYGDEIAMTGAHDPDCRRPFLWDWSEDPERVEVHEFFRQAVALRRESPCFTSGDFETLVAEGAVFAFRRSEGDDHAIVVVNAGETDVEVEIPVSSIIEDHLSSTSGGVTLSVGFMIDVLTGGRSTVERAVGGTTFTATVGAMSGAVYAPWTAQIHGLPDERE